MHHMGGDELSCVPRGFGPHVAPFAPFLIEPDVVSFLEVAIYIPFILPSLCLQLHVFTLTPSLD